MLSSNKYVGWYIMEAGIYSHIHGVNASMVFKIKEIKVNTNYAKRNNYCQLSTEKKI